MLFISFVHLPEQKPLLYAIFLFHLIHFQNLQGLFIRKWYFRQILLVLSTIAQKTRAINKGQFWPWWWWMAAKVSFIFLFFVRDFININGCVEGCLLSLWNDAPILASTSIVTILSPDILHWTQNDILWFQFSVLDWTTILPWPVLATIITLTRNVDLGVLWQKIRVIIIQIDISNFLYRRVLLLFHHRLLLQLQQPLLLCSLQCNLLFKGFYLFT